MGKVARELVENAGIDIEELLGKLVAAAGAEFTTFYYYSILRVAAIGMEGEGLKEIIEDARIEDRNHFEVLCPEFTNWAENSLGTFENLPISLVAQTPICPTASRGGKTRPVRH